MHTEADEGGDIPSRETIPHYHGNEARALFFISAVLILFAQSTGADLPLSTFGAVASAALLVIVAGITNPTQIWIHWVNGFFAVTGTLVFGTTAVARYRGGMKILDPSFIYVEALALLSLVALYFTTQTIRGILLRPRSH